MKILISWLAYNQDFNQNGTMLSKDSPNYSIHRHLPNYYYDEHIILYAKEDGLNKDKIDLLLKDLEKHFPEHKISKRLIKIDDVIDVREIKTKLTDFILELNSNKQNTIDVFISPGTPAMQVAWYFMRVSEVGNINLIQGRPAKYTESKLPEFFDVEIEKSLITAGMTYLENKKLSSADELNNCKTEQPKIFVDENYFIPRSIEVVYQKALKYVNFDKYIIFIKGDSGTGKELLANFIHRQSSRKDKNFIAVNCSCITETILQTSLFGCIKNAYDNAPEQNGYFKEANGGTIFLDEIADAPLSVQAALLRVLQNGEIQPLGKPKPEKVDVRVICATYKNLKEKVEEKTFREDLYYRIADIELELPSIEKIPKDEKEQFIQYFLKKYAKESNKNILKIEEDAKEYLLFYHYPGNIRELEKTIKKFYVECDDSVTLENLDSVFLKVSQDEGVENYDGTLSQVLEKVEKEYIEKVLKSCNGNRAKALKILGYGSINTLRDRIEKYKILIK